MTVAETTNKDSHFNTPTATAVQTARRSPPTDRRETMYRPHYYDRPIRHLFLGGFTADKNTAETGIPKGKRSPLHTHEERGHHGTGTPNSTCDSLPAPLPGAQMPAAKTTVITAPTAQGRGEVKNNFCCFTGMGGERAVLWLRATMAVLVAGAIHIPLTTGTTGPVDVVAEV
ncbi:hypothetical protein NDU88_000482 [Pleurodeles waltl]|uniref:Uncharacterized protein n=1 Tax=Pleurodeles waltl TaxID=8319 RepID=A0AAV7S8Q4_PLEWA|nr:hypothetical protein NDU88_000482 [Pleurodeles waltl]